MFLLFDIGGTHMRFAVSSDQRQVSDPIMVSTPQVFEDAMAQVKSIALKLAQGQKIMAAAGGIAGPLNRDKTTVTKYTHIPGWEGKQLKEGLEKTLECQVFLENDAALVGLGEAVSGPGFGKEIVVYMTISTGVGGVRVVRGKIDPNAYGFEPGHQVINFEGPECRGCGGKGDLESYISGTAIYHKFHQKPEDIKDPNVWEEISFYLAIGLHNVMVHWTPDIIVLGGGLMRAINIDSVKYHLKELVKIYPTIPEIEKAHIDEKAGLYGALEYLKQNFKG